MQPKMTLLVQGTSLVQMTSSVGADEWRRDTGGHNIKMNMADNFKTFSKQIRSDTGIGKFPVITWIGVVAETRLLLDHTAVIQSQN